VQVPTSAKQELICITVIALSYTPSETSKWLVYVRLPSLAWDRALAPNIVAYDRVIA